MNHRLTRNSCIALSKSLLRHQKRFYVAPRHPFDTYSVNSKLIQAGFSKEQSTSIVGILNQVINESNDGMLKNLVTKTDQERKMSTYKIDFEQLKSEIQMIEKTDFSIMKAENERLSAEIGKLKQLLREEISKSQASVRLDMSLEKGRTRDEQANQEIKIKKADSKIEQEISSLRLQMEAIKFQILQYMFGTITGAGALILAYIRMFK